MKLSEQLELKESIRRRDNYRCVDCGITQRQMVCRLLAEGKGHLRQRKLQVHRIIPDGPYSFENCKTVCSPCHSKYRRDLTGEFPPKPNFAGGLSEDAC